MRVGIDLDDVLYPMATTMHAICHRAGLHQGAPYRSWKMWEDYGCTEDEWHQALRPSIVDGTLYFEQPYIGTVEHLQRLRDAGASIHIVTARGHGIFGGATKEYTVRWLEHFAIPHDSLTFSNKKSVVKSDIFIDDALHNYNELRSSGVEAYLINRPHNLEPGPDGRFRVNTLREFVNIVLWRMGK